MSAQRRSEANLATSSALEVRVHRYPAEPEEGLRQLMDKAAATSLYAGSDWYRVLTSAVFDGRDARLYALYRHGRCVAALPVVVNDQREVDGVTSLANYYTPLYAPALAQDVSVAEFSALLRRLRSDVPSASRWTFAPMDPGSAAYATLCDALRHVGLVPFRYYAFGNWYLRAPEGWAAYLATRDGRSRGNIVRTVRKFEAAGGRAEIVRSPADVEAAVASYLAVYGSSWKQSEPYPRFIPELARCYAESGALRLGVAWLDGQPIAAQIWLVAHGRADIYKVAYNEAFKQRSPGTYLTAELMRHVLEVDKVREVDYLIGDDAYKKDWMSDRRERWGIVAYDPRSLRGLVGLGREAGGRWAKAAWRRLQGHHAAG
jgi:hypothetical protein